MRTKAKETLTFGKNISDFSTIKFSLKKGILHCFLFGDKETAIFPTEHRPFHHS
jgi:hypothetical protein